MDRRWWTLTAVCTGVFMLLLDVTIVNVALPQIQRALHADLSDLQWVVDAYALTLAAFMLSAGSLADLRGRRLVFATGIVVFSIGSALCGGAPTATFLALARGFQGIGGAIMFAVSLALIAQAFPPLERGVAFGAFGAVTGVALAVGPVLGGTIITALSWRWIFFVNVPIGAFALALTLLRVEESKLPHAPRIDLAGFVTFSLGLAGLVYGLIISQSDGWHSVAVIASLAGAAVLLVAFVVIERHVGTPMFDLQLLRVPTFNGGLVAAWALSASLFSMFTYIIIYLQDILGYSALAAGVRFLPMSAMVFVVASIAGRLTTKVSARSLIGTGFALAAVGMLLMRGITPGDGWTHLLPGFIVAGAGSGLISVPLASTAVGVVPAQRAGMASGINSTLRQVGIATGVAGLGTILSSSIVSHVISGLAHTPLAAHAHKIAAGVAGGGIRQAVSGMPPALHHLVFGVARVSYVDALNTILLIGVIIAVFGFVATVPTIRQRDFHVGHVPTDGAQQTPAVVP